MKGQPMFFEIPAVDFARAVEFYNRLFETRLTECSCEAEGSSERMAFFPDSATGIRMAVSKAAGFEPSRNGVLVSFDIGGDLEQALVLVPDLGGSVLVGKTQIEAEGAGHFALIVDTEGNRIGLHSQ